MSVDRLIKSVLIGRREWGGVLIGPPTRLRVGCMQGRIRTVLIAPPPFWLIADIEADRTRDPSAGDPALYGVQDRPRYVCALWSVPYMRLCGPLSGSHRGLC